MPENSLEEQARKTLADADAVLARSGMSAKRKRLALKLLKDAATLRKLRMVNKKPKRIKPRLR
jgi:hypothetical protein